MTILAIDPGESTGLALFTDTGRCIERWIASADDTINYLAVAHTITDVICEDFRLRQGKAVKLSGSRFPAIQIIGAVRLFCRMHRIPLHLQEPGVLVVAALHSGVKQPSDHSKSHDIDAYNHGYWWFEKAGILKPISRLS